MKYLVGLLILFLGTVAITNAEENAVMVNLTLPNGKKIVHPYSKSGSPLPAENELIKVQFIGPNISADKNDKTKPILQWVYKCDAKNSNIKSIEVYDLDSGQPDRLGALGDLAFMFDNAKLAGKWGGLSKPVEATKDLVAWLYDLNETKKTFEFRVVDKDGNTHSLFQPTSYSAASKQELLKNVRQITGN